MSAGTFIALEGVDGAGKSSQVAALRRRFTDAGRSVLCVREPGGTALGESVREILLDRGEIPLTAEAETLLFLASRVQLYEELIRPALERGDVVVSDRFHLSTIVYQGMAGTLGRDRAVELCAAVLGDRRPELNVVLRLPVATAQGRLAGDPDRFESRAGFLPRVVESFEALVAEPTLAIPGDRVVGVDATGDEQAVAERIWKLVEA